MLEFAIGMVPFFYLVFGIFEVGLLFWSTYELENATKDAARMIRVGQVYKDRLDETAFKAQLCARAPILSDCTTKLRVDVQNYDSFSQLSPPSPLDSDGNLNNDFTYAPGGPQRVVLVTAFYEWPLLNIMSGASLSNMANGHRLLRATVAFRSEPFPE
ncbi:MAG: pilus assembly protein [Alphaproteobacteria bacterium]